MYCEDASVNALADRYGTPLYVYSKASLVNRFRAFKKAFAAHDTTICFSVKSCPTLAILAVLRGEGAGFDVVSGGELFRALKAGGDRRKIVYAGVGKT
ncbi:MAG: diaminopimelate decarboxylase, partial [Planctomycetes bacterium]|nr:diaminopimelate decarboxylase [Planctomycetota bacterium]